MAEQFRPPICARIRATRERLKQEAQVGGGREAAREYSQERVAQRMGISLKAYRAYEDYREPRYARRQQIAKALGLPADHFETDPDQALDALREEVAALREELAQIRRPARPQES